MTDIKNPSDSLHNYFAELLADDNVHSVTDSHAEQLSIFPVDTAFNIVDSVAPPPAFTTHVVAKKIAVKAITTKVNITTNFADPSADQKQKLQKLLHSVRPEIAVTPAVKVEIISAPAVITSFQTDPNEIQEWTIEPVVPTAIVVADEVFTESSVALQGIEKNYEMPGLEWLPNGLPQWAQTRFEVLLFKVSGLTLAVPLISLGKIRPITAGLASLPGQAEWFMGLQLTTTGKVYTVNTAKFVMPERYDENFTRTAKYVISINGVPWGLAVDSVNQPIRLMPDEVKWRTNRSKRPWLAGTIKEHMCALLDIPMIGQMLMDADKNCVKNSL
ncbi:MAG: chemotaxis protein CheW [Pseudomonadota bacterium]